MFILQLRESHGFTFFENYINIANVSVRVLGQEMVAHSKGKLKRVWKGLFRGVGGGLQLGMVKHTPIYNRGKRVPPLRLPGQR